MACDVGEGLFFAGQNHVALRVIASPEEHELITTDPRELLKRQNTLAAAKTAARFPISFLAIRKIKTVEARAEEIEVSLPQISRDRPGKLLAKKAWTALKTGNSTNLYPFGLKIPVWMLETSW